MQTILRPAAVAGMFYPGQAQELDTEVSAMIEEASPPALRPKALIAPHAGYVYSGPIAATAYATLQPLHDLVRRVVLLGPVHRVPVRGLATTSATAFKTPLGNVPVDRMAVEKALQLPQVTINDRAHADEHSLEVHLPFLQAVLDDFSIVPFAVGDATDEEVEEVLSLLWGGGETLILVSSDLSHYHPYAEARQLDHATADSILHLERLSSHEQACGATPINGLLAAARRHGLKPQLLDARNSGDTAGDRTRVVGYASFAFCENNSQVPEVRGPKSGDETDALGKALLTRARNAIARQLGVPTQAEPPHGDLDRPGATFVTLTENGVLRGCIGSLEPHRDLDSDVRANAIAAAFDDPRFSPLQMEEWPRLQIEVSLLSPAEPIQFADEDEAIRQLRPGIDGVIFEYCDRRSTFLPQVWESLPEPQDFLAQLKRKAGLSGDFWAQSVKLYRYEVRKWKEIS